MAHYRTHLLFVAISLISLISIADHSSSLDSLENVILNQVSSTRTSDTSTVDLINKYTRGMLRSDIDKAYSYALQGIELAKKLEYIKGEAKAQQNLGVIYKTKNEFYKAMEAFDKSSLLFEGIERYQDQGFVLGEIGNIYKNLGSFESALKYHFKSATVKENAQDSAGLGYTYDLIGAIYSDQKMYDQALKYHNKAVDIKKIIDNQKGLAYSLDQIGRIYRHLQSYDRALDYHMKASKIKKEIGNDMGLAYTYDQIGRIYRAQKNYDQALEYHEKASEIKERIGNKKGLAYTFDHIGKIYLDMESYHLAIAYQIKAAEIKREIGNINGLAISLLNIGHTYTASKDYDKALQHLNDALGNAKSIGSKTILKDVYLELSICYKQMEDFESSLNFFSRYSDIKDSIISEESMHQIAEMQTKYGTERQEKELQINELELTKNKAELKMSQTLLASVSVGLLLILALSGVVFRNFRQKKKANLMLERKNLAITQQSEIIENRNRKITDSIDYAKRIQEALLSNTAKVSRLFKNSFVLFKPKDVVSGDFFWIKQMDELILFAVADCTGHGVPGAFMSIICNNVLNDVASRVEFNSPAHFLEVTNNTLISRLQQKVSSNGSSFDQSGLQVKDGMDIALCFLNTNTLQLSFAGAHNPLYLIRNKELIETKADKLFIGNATDLKFTNHKVQLEKGDCLYLFTDGYADQKGGMNKKKFYYQPFQDMLLEIQSKGMKEQHDHLDTVITDWKNGQEQIDDIIVFGVKV